MSLEIDGAPDQEKLSDRTMDQLFSQLKPEDIEQFYMAYQLWSQRQQLEQLQRHILILQQQVAENTAQMEQVQPSAIALASLAQLQAYGVTDTDLLDKMLDRGEEWLDHSIQLLERCEQLDLIGGDYTQWCEHALEGAYDWIESITEPEAREAATGISTKSAGMITDEAEVTEELLLKKLMSEGEEEHAKPEAIAKPRITQPLSPLEDIATTDDATQVVATVKPSKRITQPLSENDESEAADDVTQIVAAIKPSRRITQPHATAGELEEKSNTAQITTVAEPAEPAKPSRRITQPLSQEDEATIIDEPINEPITASSSQSATMDTPQDTAQPGNNVATMDTPQDTAQPGNNVATTDIDQAEPPETTLTDHIDKDQIKTVSGDTAGEDYKQREPLQELPASKRVTPKKKRGFLRWLLAKILRRSRP